MAQTADKIIYNGLLLTMDGNMTIIEGGAIAISDNIILATGKTQEILSTFDAVEKLDSNGSIIMPGLINTHAHLAMVLLRGLAEDLPLWPWLQQVWKVEAAFMTPDNVAIASQLGMVESIMGGVTCTVDMYWHPERTAQAAREIGFRLVNGPVFLDSDHAPDGLSFAERDPYAKDFLAEFSNDPLVYPMFMPHSTVTDSPAALMHVKELANDYQVDLNIHCAETATEAKDVFNRTGKTPVDLLNSIGLLDGRIILAHCVHVTPREIDILAQKGVTVAHNPVSNLKLASGIAPISLMMQKGINVTIGTDGAQSSNDLNMWLAVRLAAMLQKEHYQDASLMKAPEMIKMVTINAAKGIGLGDSIGSLEPGKKADLILLDLQSPHLTPMYDVYAQLVYTVGRDDVESVMINGRWNMRHRELIHTDVGKILANVNQIAQEIKKTC
jgi:5-methylthioadenosine/S-adenosylhomocysteine deaminase